MFHVQLGFLFFVNLSHTMQNGPMFHVEHLYLHYWLHSYEGACEVFHVEH